MRLITSVLTAACILLSSLPIHAQNQHIYLIKIFSNPARAQTGFRVHLRGLKGIVTALHGVANLGSTKIVAENEKGAIDFRGLKISKVDVANDLALLSNPDLNASQEGGLPYALNPRWDLEKPFLVIGSPFGLRNWKATVEIGDDKPRRLDSLIPDMTDYVAQRSELSTRKSPSLGAEVIGLGGFLSPGFSGAPVLNKRSEVVAVVNGGLQGLGISWAIPLQNARWEDPETSNLYRTLIAQSQGKRSVLYDVDLDVPPTFPITTSRHDTGNDTVGEGHHMTTDLSIDVNGLLSATIRLENKVRLNGFCGRLVVALLDRNNRVISQIGPGSQYCVDPVFQEAIGQGHASRTEQWTAMIPREILIQVRSIAILQTSGSKDPFDLIRDNAPALLQIADTVKLD